MSEFKQPSEPRESPGWRRHVALQVAGAFLVAGIAAVSCQGSEATSPEELFRSKYTQEGGCLDDTAFDPDQGATISVGTIDTVDVLTTTPKAIADTQPSALNFSFVDGVFFPGDYATGSVMVTAGCPDAPEGY